MVWGFLPALTHLHWPSEGVKYSKALVDWCQCMWLYCLIISIHELGIPFSTNPCVIAGRASKPNLNGLSQKVPIEIVPLASTPFSDNSIYLVGFYKQ